MKVIVVDLDGTLCDARHREIHAHNREWDAFHEAHPFDLPHQDVAWALWAIDEASKARKERTMIIGCTGRPERYRRTTEDWLRKHELPIDFVLMRPNFDFRPDAELKPRLLEEWRQAAEIQEPLSSLVLFVLEDRDVMVMAWRRHGVNCWQVREALH